MRVKYTSGGRTIWQGGLSEYFDQVALLMPEVQREISSALESEGRYEIDEDEYLEREGR